MSYSHRKKTVVFLVGPTASGKTSLSLLLAEKINAQIISCDSMQIYRGMDIVSQAPTADQRRRVKHYLVGTLSPREEYSASLFSRKAVAYIKAIIKKRKIPLIVGGSGLYVKALIDGLFPCPKKDVRFREKMSRYVSRYGKKKLYEKLLRCDPVSAANIHQNDTRRIIRALEVFHVAGAAMSALRKETKGIRNTYNTVMIGVTMPRERLYRSIDERVERMFAEGLFEEISKLMKIRLSRTAQAAVGVKEIRGCLDGLYPLEEAKELLKRNTRRLAKKQMTWFRPDRAIRWIDVSGKSDRAAVAAIAKIVKQKMSA